MSASVVSLAQARVQRNCRMIQESNQRTLGHVRDLQKAQRSLASSLDTVRDGLVEFSDALDGSIQRLHDSGARQQRIMDRIERIQASSDAFR
ncbi:hypothetical protein [Caenispirillum salinarum]|uniref:hypothetical protein n=1 Tax=Caenispirillum salinarum TaxID=859058 RepID=UPI00384FE6C1